MCIHVKKRINKKNPQPKYGEHCCWVAFYNVKQKEALMNARKTQTAMNRCRAALDSTSRGSNMSAHTENVSVWVETCSESHGRSTPATTCLPTMELDRRLFEVSGVVLRAQDLWLVEDHVSYNSFRWPTSLITAKVWRYTYLFVATRVKCLRLSGNKM